MPSITFHTGNITGNPLSTLTSALMALAQFLALNGTALPHDVLGWVSLGLGALVSVVGALAGTQPSAADLDRLR